MHATSNGGTGISATDGSSTVTGNTANFNGGPGIAATGIVTGNTVSFNTGPGLALSAPTGDALNVISGNSGGTVAGRVSLGHNLCNGAAC
jgi:hypothetical protein